jgi:hypothetical protein
MYCKLDVIVLEWGRHARVACIYQPYPPGEQLLTETVWEVHGLLTVQREEVVTGTWVVTCPYLVFVFVTVVYFVSVVGFVVVWTPEVTPVLVTVTGEECLMVDLVTRTSSTRRVVVITSVTVFSGNAC